MAAERLILCGGVPDRPTAPGAGRPVGLHIYGHDPNVRVGLEEIRRALWKPLDPVFRDLLEVAAYVFAADQATTRANGGRVDGPEIGSGWRRNLRFVIPVMEPDLWNSAPVREALVAALSFASDDEFAFEFVPHPTPPPFDGLIAFADTPFDGEVGGVMCFSGGIDSLAGAVEEAANARRKVLLVHHRSNPKDARRHAALVAELERAFGPRAPLHVSAVVNEREGLNREYTQRTRSFLFTALASTFAGVIGLDRVRFYENGVTSLNLPPSGQVVGARASRTTHPRVLAGYAALLTALLGKRFAIESPFVTKTKTEVVQVLQDAGVPHLLALSTSCGHTWERTHEHTHCGVCSQCIDRRFAVLAAGQAEYDPAERYAVDLLTGARPAGDPRVMLTGYVDLADRVSRMGVGEFYQQFGEAVRALPYLNQPLAVAGQQVHDLLRRHAAQVNGAISAAIRDHSDLLRQRTLPPTCLLRLVVEAGSGDVPDESRADTDPPADARPEGSYYVRRGTAWVVRFEPGTERHYPAERGFDLLRILLTHPGRTFTASELEAACPHGSGRQVRAASAADAAGAGHGPGGDIGAAALDAEAFAALTARLERIHQARQQVEPGSSPDAVDTLDELAEEENRILAQLNRDTRPGGRSRVVGDARNRVRNRVGNAIRRALKLVKRYDPNLSAHLTPPTLRLGYTLCYSPRSEFAWAVRG